MSETQKYDDINNPERYNHGGIECIDALQAAFGKEAVCYFCLCNAMKYLWRCEYKEKESSLDKAIWYIKKFKELSANE